MRKAGELGERKIIEIIKGCLETMPKMPVPFGDDISAVQFNRNTLAVIKTDMLIGKTDVPQGMSLRQAARKAVVMNVSDFAAKGVSPVAVLVALGLPRSCSEEDIRQIGLGLNEGAREYGTYVIGGDTGESSDLVIQLLASRVLQQSNLGEKKHRQTRRHGRCNGRVWKNSSWTKNPSRTKNCAK